MGDSNQKCSTMCGGLLLVAGLLFLLVDLGMWDFWGISWWTVAFLLLGLGKCAKANCMMGGKKKR